MYVCTTSKNLGPSTFHKIFVNSFIKFFGMQNYILELEMMIESIKYETLGSTSLFAIIFNIVCR